jgi:hypothetical protein
VVPVSGRIRNEREEREIPIIARGNEAGALFMALIMLGGLDNELIVVHWSEADCNG